MAHYVDKGAQTTIAGLTKHPSANPSVLFDATTPPEDMPTKELQLPSEAMPPVSMNGNDANATPSLLLRRKNRPPLVARLSLPHSEIDEGPRSPPPTEAVMSPLPLANKLHAGHTPIIPRARSPLLMNEDERSASSASTPDEDQALDGPLQLPAQPGDGNEFHIELKVLDAELEKLAKEQSATDQEDEHIPSQSMEYGGQNSREGSSEGRRRSSADEIIEVVDGVRLKKPKWNMGAPLGQA